MSMKQHELNILKNVTEKAEGISVRLQKWADELHAFIKQEIAEEEAKIAKLKAQESLGAHCATNPLTDGAGLALQGAGAIDSSQTQVSEPVADQAPAPAAPETPVDEAPVAGNVPENTVPAQDAPVAQPSDASAVSADEGDVLPETQPTSDATGEATEASAATPPSDAAPSTATE